MALVVEDGTGIEDANSYVSVAELQAFAADRGITLPATDEAVSYLLVKATDYIDSIEFAGVTEFADQGLSFPRTTTDSSGATTSIGVPKAVKKAQCLLAVEAQSGALQYAARSGKYKRTKIDQIYVEYRDAFEVAFGFSYPAVDALLRPYTSLGGRAFLTVKA